MSAVQATVGGTRVRTRARVTGTVQGVGFRPFVYRLAHELGLAGYVLNDERGVLLEVEGPAVAVEEFMGRLVDEAPPLAVIEGVVAESVPAVGSEGFEIVSSLAGGEADAPVTPDSAICSDCLAELLDPADRRYRYPFINCTNCGPRFSIVRGVPYDRPQTTMAAFTMCEQCRREYENPRDRRFHAQPNACASCGPRVWVHGVGASVEDPIAFVARRLREGAIVAVKGVGGFHLACDAFSSDAVAALRARKHREDKPFALMVRDVAAASRLVALGPVEKELLSSVVRPIVLAPRRFDSRVAGAVAPAASELGVMLPYSPLHHLLLGDFGGALVMTSGNVSDEPIAFKDDDALERLAPIADLFLLHDREIHARTDDSVVRSGAILRRSRGYVPGRMSLPVAASRPLLACGAEQKNTFCVAKGDHAWVSHHIGDLEHYPTLRAFRTGIDHFERLFAVTPEVAVYDLHPDYLSTAYAHERPGLELFGVQHHHAHLAACLAEHGLQGPAVGAIFDGTGYGTDGTIWGGEVLAGGLGGCERAAWLRPVRLPGGAAAIREPWRMAFAWLAEAFGEPQAVPRALTGSVDERAWDAMAAVALSPDFSPVTSSVGRLFDAVGALCGFGVRASYEGQAAVELEAAAHRADGAAGAYRFTLSDPRSAVQEVVFDLERGVAVSTVAARFHFGLARATVEAVAGVASERGLSVVVLSGGVFQNRLLLDAVRAGLARAGLRVLTPEKLPANDGGISFGQAAIAAAAARV